MEEQNIIERLVRYCNDILDGKILAGKKHKSAIRRFLRDLERSQTDDYPYHFDLETVDDFYEWSKLFKHRKGVLAGQTIEINDYQLFICANIFGWKHKKTGYRRFSESYIQMARKQAKSQLLALIGSYECFINHEQGQSETYCAANSRDQAKLVYEEILFQIKNCELLQGKFSDSYHRITHLKSGSIIRALSTDTTSLDGLNPTLSILDEIHEMKDSSLYDVLSSGSVRPNAHICSITTAGFSLSGIAYQKYKFVSDLLDEENPIENENFFAFVCEQDPEDKWDDPTTWVKSNPILTSYPEFMDFLLKRFQIASQQPDAKRSFLVKNLNRWIEDKKSGFIPLSKWNECADKTLKLSDFKGKHCIVGVDLSTKYDITSVSFIFEENGEMIIFNHSFIPKDTMEEKIASDGVRYDLWEEDGWLTTIEGSVIDQTIIENYIHNTEQEHGFFIKEIGSDPWNSAQFLVNMDSKGYVVVEIRQIMSVLAPPTKIIKERVYAKTLKHDGNPLLAWSVGNAIQKNDHAGNYTLDKSKSTNRIDPIVSVVIGSVRFASLSNDLSESILSDDWGF